MTITPDSPYYERIDDGTPAYMPAPMNTDARRAASAAYHAKRTESGLRKVTLWLSPEARFKLDALKAAAGSKDKAAELAILAWSGPGAPQVDANPAIGDGLVARVKSARAKAPEPVKLKPIPPADTHWPSGAALLPEHTEDPGPSAAMKVEVPLLQRKAFNPQQKKGGKK